MKCLIGIGSNLGNRPENLEQAARQLRQLSFGAYLRCSAVYETAALVPPGAPDAWDIPFLNAAVEMDWSGPCEELLKAFKKIESDAGRIETERWAPRPIDLDILVFGREQIDNRLLKVPHRGVWERSFVLGPLKDIQPTLYIPGKTETLLARARQVCKSMPLWMGILNLTPDSFSDGGRLVKFDLFERKVEEFEKAGVAIFDIGAESTRPGAQEVSPLEEWERLQPALAFLKERYKGRIFRPRISVDTRHKEVAAKALALYADCINDVSGLDDPALLELLKESDCEYVLMHSLSVPADRNVTLPPACDAIETIKHWAERKLEELDSAGVGLDRVIFDPGIGFGKTPKQSLDLLRRIEEFFSLPVRLLIGHSRKAFINTWGERPANDRDWESAGISLQMALRGVDIIRVHEPPLHIRAHTAFKGVSV